MNRKRSVNLLPISAILLIFLCGFALSSSERTCKVDDGHHHHHHHHSHDLAHDDHNCKYHHHSEKPQPIRKLPEELEEDRDNEIERHGLDSHHSHDHHRLSGLSLWLSSLSCSLLVSLASLVCLILLPILFVHGKPSKSVVDSLALFGAGAMLGDAFLHQLPHAFGEGPIHSHDHNHHAHDHNHQSHSHSHSHSLKDLSVGLSILGGIVLFFLVEKLVRYVEENSDRSSSRTHVHSHHHNHKKVKNVKSDQKRNEKTTESDTPSSNLVFGYLNLFSDGVHNFTDGIALGNAFALYGWVGGWSRTVFLLAHELPQEIGDFGILVRSGFTVKEALCFNFLSALVALVGTAMALIWGRNSGKSSLIEGFTAGGFIYIAVGGVLAEMNSGKTTLSRSLLQLTSLMSGMVVALCISLVE